MKHTTFLSIALSSLVGFLTVSPVSAQPQRNPCPDPQQEQPSSDTREITNDEYGLRFQVPNNYSALLERNGDQLTVIVRNPADARFADCASRNQVRGWGHVITDVRVSVYPIPAGIRTPSDVVRQASNARGVQVSSSVATVAGRDAVIYDTQSLYPSRTRTALLTHPDGLNFVSVSIYNYGESIGSIDAEVFDEIVSSFELDYNRAAIDPVPLTSSSRLTLDGIGSVRVGMTVSEAQAATGMRFIQGNSFGRDPRNQCSFYTPENGPTGLSFMVIGDTIRRIDVSGVVEDSPIETLSGAGIGDSEDSIISLYPGQIEVSPHPYLSGRGNYLTYVPEDDEYRQYGLIFETYNGRVNQFRSGFQREVSRIEGCS